MNKQPLRLLIGGSPCQHWSIAQQNNREVTASGEGWELFKNYLIVKEKFKPDYFLYENNKSASQAIKDQISFELGHELQYINSALVSAQNRQRFYCHNIPNVNQPDDRGILLKDILEDDAMAWQEKSYCLTTRCNGAILSDTLTKHRHTMVAKPIRIGDIGSNSQGYRVYSPEGKSVTLCANGGGAGAKTGLYMCPTLKPKKEDIIYNVRDCLIEYNGDKYNINLPDGYYKIRKLTPLECERLQTLPDNYTNCGISNTQRYRCLGNGWTAEVIIHILSHINYPKDYPIEVLSMYDGIATGKYCLEKLGYTNIIYKSYEIDKYAIKVATKNYPDIIEYGDAFQVREDDWRY